MPEFISFFESGGISTEKERAEHLMQRRANLLFELFPDTYPDYEHLLNELNLIKAELRSYNSSRLIQAIRCIQKRILKSMTNVCSHRSPTLWSCSTEKVP